MYVFGHRDTPDSAEPQLRKTMVRLIEEDGVDTFLVGHQGNFDSLVRRVWRTLAPRYPRVHCTVVLARLPRKEDAEEYGEDTLYPEGLEHAPPRYAIDRRNRWMLDRAEHVITYVTAPCGGAAKFKALAEKSDKCVHELAIGGGVPDSPL